MTHDRQIYAHVEVYDLRDQTCEDPIAPLPLARILHDLMVTPTTNESDFLLDFEPILNDGARSGIPSVETMARMLATNAGARISANARGHFINGPAVACAEELAALRAAGIPYAIRVEGDTGTMTTESSFNGIELADLEPEVLTPSDLLEVLCDKGIAEEAVAAIAERLGVDLNDRAIIDGAVDRAIGEYFDDAVVISYRAWGGNTSSKGGES